MACIGEFDCRVCGRVRRELVPADYVCAACRVETDDRDRRMHFAALKGLTVEERLELLESHFYELKAERRLAALEAKTATY